MEGILITLKKWRLNTKGTGYLNNSFSVWGYYDVLEIEKVNQWSEFSPKNIHQNRKTPTSGIFSNEVHLKLLMLDNARKLENKYKQIFFAQNDIDNSIFVNRPLLTMVLFRFTKNIINTKGLDAAVTEVNERIAKIIETLKLEPEDMPFFAVYPTIGFMDAVMVFRSNNFCSISEIVFTLRSEADLLYSSYAIPCVYAKENVSLDAWKKCSRDNVTRISIRVTLKPGVSTNEFIDKYKSETSELGVDEKDVYFEMFGNSDVLVLPEISASTLSPLYIDKKRKLLQPPYNLITSVRSSIRILSAGTGEKHDHPSSEPQRKLEIDFYRMLQEHLENDDKSMMTTRIKDGLLNMADFYFDLTNSSHAYDIQTMMDPVLESLLKNIKMVVNNKLIDELSPDTFNYAISRLRDAFTDLMNDFARANKHMFEGRWFKHPSIASASKLLMAYHCFITDVINMFKNGSTYTFLTTSGGVDHVTAENLFYFNIPDEITGEEHPLMILRLSEAALFSPSLTLFYSLHEVFHFVGERFREKRNMNILKSLAQYISDTLEREFWGLLSPLSDDWRKEFIRNKTKFKALLESQNVITKKNNIELIKGCLRVWNVYLSKEPPVSQYAKHWEDKAYDAINNACDDIEYLAKKLVVDYLNYNSFAIIKLKANRIVELELIEAFVQNTLQRKNEYKCKKKEYEKAVEKHMNSLYGNNITFDEDESIPGMFETLNESYRESFADMCSVILLKSTKNDYLNTFYPKEYSQKDKTTTATLLRIVSVVKACFPNEQDYFCADDEHNQYVASLFTEIQNHNRVIEPLVEYLIICKKELEMVLSGHSEPIKKLRDIYVQSRLINVMDIPNLNFRTVMNIIN